MLLATLTRRHRDRQTAWRVGEGRRGRRRGNAARKCSSSELDARGHAHTLGSFIAFPQPPQNAAPGAWRAPHVLQKATDAGATGSVSGAGAGARMTMVTGTAPVSSAPLVAATAAAGPQHVSLPMHAATPTPMRMSVAMPPPTPPPMAAALEEEEDPELELEPELEPEPRTGFPTPGSEAGAVHALADVEPTTAVCERGVGSVGRLGVSAYSK